MGPLDLLYWREGLDPLPSPAAASSVIIKSFEDPTDLSGRVFDAVASLLRAGVALADIGVVSCLSRVQSNVLTGLCSPQAVPSRGFLLTEAPALDGLACDSFAYWFGLERRAVIVVEAPGKLARRRLLLHTALSRACESVTLVMPTSEIETDDVLSSWMRASRAPDS